MYLTSFLKLVELQTKIASFIPFVFGVIYTLFRFNTIKPMQVLFFFISLLSFDMFTTALNNYNDFKKAVKKEGYNYEFHNAISQFNLKESTVVTIIALLFSSAVVFGLITFLRSDYLVLLLGCLSFLMGILYSAGPIPISRTCFGEVFSGFFMGLLIPFLVIYISIYDQNFIGLTLNESNLILILNWKAILPIVFTALPTVFCIANIMLANNICDIDDDFANKRYTLPIHVGKKKSFILYDALYIFAYLDIILCVILGYLPWVSLLVLASAFMVYKNVKAFYALQTKKDTFALTVQNLIFIMVPLILSVFAAFVFNTIIGS